MSQNLKGIIAVNTTISLLIICIQLPCHCVSGENRSVLILAKPQSFLSEQSSNYGQRQEILSEAFENVVGIINNDSSLHSLELITADSGVITRYDDPYSGNVLQVIANCGRVLHPVRGAAPPT